jgi:hypothetical protein
MHGIQIAGTPRRQTRRLSARTWFVRATCAHHTTHTAPRSQESSATQVRLTAPSPGHLPGAHVRKAVESRGTQRAHGSSAYAHIRGNSTESSNGLFAISASHNRLFIRLELRKSFPANHIPAHRDSPFLPPGRHFFRQAPVSHCLSPRNTLFQHDSTSSQSVLKFGSSSCRQIQSSISA